MNCSAFWHLSPRVGKYLLSLSIIWTVVMAAFFVIERSQLLRTAEELAITQANESFEKDLLYRHWNASHGGVYVPVTPETQPNPHLSHIPERDLVTPSGR